jgi:hypothetical protein
MTRDDIVSAMEMIPNLGGHGVGIFDPARKLSPAERAASLEAERESLLSDVEGCTRVCEWLSDLEPIRTVKHSSYGLKHLAEKEIGYITNGAFIAAAVHAGFPFRVNPGSPNVTFGISERSLKRKREMQTAR